MSSLPTSPPPPPTRELNRWVIDDARHIPGLRSELLAALIEHRLITTAALDHRADQVLLVVTELASNALKHGLPPSVVRLLLADGCFILDIADYDMTAVPELREVQPLDSGGRGLFLARQMSLDVGWYATDTTKHIWATFPTTGPAASAGT